MVLMKTFCPITRDRLDPRNIELMDPAMVPVLRRLSSAQKLQTVHDMFHAARSMALAAVREQYPDWSETQVLEEVQLRLSGARTSAIFDRR